MQCPECKQGDLTPTKLEPSLPARGCLTCHGAVLDLVAWRLWRERHPEEGHLGEGQRGVNQGPKPEPEAPAAPGRALTCPGCSRLMVRFRYTLDTPHVLDVCSHCDLAWLQENEWEWLKHLELAGTITRLFTDPWQRNLRRRRTEQTFETEWDERLGPELHEEARELKAWLDAQPNRDALLDYLRTAKPYQATDR